MGGRTDFKPGIENKEEGVKSRTNMHCGTCQIILMERKGGGATKHRGYCRLATEKGMKVIEVWNCRKGRGAGKV